MKEFTTLSPSKLVAARNVCKHNLSSVNIAWVKGPTNPSPVSTVTGPRQSKGQRATMRNEPNFDLSLFGSTWVLPPPTDPRRLPAQPTERQARKGHAPPCKTNPIST